MSIKTIVILAAILPVLSCGSGKHQPRPDTENEHAERGIYLAGMVATTESIQKDLVNNHCISCHNATHNAGNLDYRPKKFGK